MNSYNVELNMRRGELFRAVLFTWGENDLLDALDVDFFVEWVIFRSAGERYAFRWID